MFNYDPSKFQDRVAARKQAEDFWSKAPKQTQQTSGTSLSGLGLLFILAAILFVALGG